MLCKESRHILYFRKRNLGACRLKEECRLIQSRMRPIFQKLKLMASQGRVVTYSATRIMNELIDCSAPTSSFALWSSFLDERIFILQFNLGIGHSSIGHKGHLSRREELSKREKGKKGGV